MNSQFLVSSSFEKSLKLQSTNINKTTSIIFNWYVTILHSNPDLSSQFQHCSAQQWGDPGCGLATLTPGNWQPLPGKLGLWTRILERQRQSWVSHNLARKWTVGGKSVETHCSTRNKHLFQLFIILHYHTHAVHPTLCFLL